MRTSWLSEEQLQLREMLNHMLADGPVSDARLAELGLFGATLPTDYGGLGFGVVEATIIAEALGRAKHTAPFIETTIIAGGLIDALGSPSQKGEWLPAIATGSLRVAIAFAEGLRFDPLVPGLSARCSDNGYILDGTKTPVVGAADADLVLMNARSNSGISLYLVPTPDLQFSPPIQTVDGLAAATLTLSGHRVPPDSLLGADGGGAEALDDVLHKAMVAQAAEQTGLMAHLIDATTGYLKQRRQFGVPLASFQVLQHRVADMLIAYEKAAALVVKARFAGDGPLTPERRRVSLQTSLLATRAALQVGHDAIQLHGGMGVTEELSIGPTVKRIYALESRLGAVEAKAAKFADQIYAA
jgi:alkylation response protein AidB-like acyl-CoA dehydrogenase